MSKRLFKFDDDNEDELYNEISQIFLFKPKIAEKIFEQFATKTKMVTLY